MQKVDTRKETNAERSVEQEEGAERTQRGKRDRERTRVWRKGGRVRLAGGKHRVIECFETATMTDLQ